MSKNNFSIDQITEMMEKCKEYSPDNITDHLAQLEKRRQLLNQTCTSTRDQIKYQRIESMYNSAKHTYTTIHDYTLEDKLDIMKKLGQLNKDMLELEESKKGVGEDSEK